MRFELALLWEKTVVIYFCKFRNIKYVICVSPFINMIALIRGKYFYAGNIIEQDLYRKERVSRNLTVLERLSFTSHLKNKP